MGTAHEESLRLEGLLGVPPLIRVNGKRPIDTGWTEGPRSSASIWRRRLHDHNGNIGLVTGDGLVVIDADLYHPEARDSLDRLHELGLPRQTVTVITGGGGQHLYYRTDGRIGSGPLGGFPGIDVKADGGYVVVPPSVHAVSGRAYEWEHGWTPDDLEPATLPVALVELLDRSGTIEPGELDERDEAAVNLLLDHLGGHSPRYRGTYVEVTRPGKEARLGGSATVGALGRGVVRVWSSNWDGLDATTYSLGELRRLVGIETPRIEVPELAPPEGFRWWTPLDAVRPTPILGDAAYHGPLGEYMGHVSELSEAHPASVGFTVLTYLGTVLGRAVTYAAGRAIRHHPNLWGTFVGPSSSGAKGISWDAARLFLDTLDPTIVAGHTISGLGSGPVLVDRLATTDEEPHPRELVVQDHELGSVLVVCKRDGSTLSEELRKAFDLEPLGSHTRSHGTRTASGYFLAALGSITDAELRSHMDELSILNGFGNRWLYIWSELRTLRPFGDDLDPVLVGRLTDAFSDSVGDILGAEYRMDADPETAAIWEPFYIERRRGIGRGVVTSLTARHHVHAARIATLLAAVDGSTTIRPPHLRAAIAWCDYSLHTVELVFGEGVVGDASVLLDAIRDAGPNGLTGTEQSAVFNRHRSSDELGTFRAELEAAHLIHTIEEPTGGPKRLRSLALTPCETAK